MKEGTCSTAYLKMEYAFWKSTPESYLFGIVESSLSRKVRRMVYCDSCGARAGSRDKYCRICGRKTNPPPISWRIRSRLVKRADPAASGNPSELEKTAFLRIHAASSPKGVELEHRRIGHGNIESKSAINTPQATRIIPDTVHSGKALTQVEHLEIQQKKEPESTSSQEDLLLKLRELQSQKTVHKRRPSSTIVGYVLVGIGGVSLVSAAVLTSTILTFTGLGLVFWGAILLFIRPQKYVQSDLMNSTALSSLRTIDRVMVDLGYTEKGVYIPAGNPEKAVVFVPSEPFTRIPKAREIEHQTFIKNPKGIAMIPPGLALANLIERGLGVNLSKCALETLRDRLPKLLIEDLEMVQDFEMQIDGNNVRFKFVESIYRDFCNQLRGSTRVSCALGCPICSAMACILTMTTGKPVSFEEDKYSTDGRILESSYRILEA